ncbi:hypothetical protein HK096_011584, partial [Nowakowskiella sp. JEL0078]
MGFQTSAVSNFRRCLTVQIIDPHKASSKEAASDYHFEVPYMISRFYKDMSTDAIQIMSEGSLDLVYGKCVDVWTGLSLQPLNEAIERRLADLHNNLEINDSKVILYTYRAIPGMTKLPPLCDIDSSDTELASEKAPKAFVTLETGGNTCDDEGLRKRKGVGKDFETVLEDVGKDQTLLGMASLSYPLKQNV